MCVIVCPWWISCVMEGRIRGDRPEGSRHTRFLRKLVKRIYCILINPSFIHLECLHGNQIFVSQRWAFRLWKLHSAPYKNPCIRENHIFEIQHAQTTTPKALSVLLGSMLVSFYQRQDLINFLKHFLRANRDICFISIPQKHQVLSA